MIKNFPIVLFLLGISLFLLGCQIQPTMVQEITMTDNGKTFLFVELPVNARNPLITEQMSELDKIKKFVIVSELEATSPTVK